MQFNSEANNLDLCSVAKRWCGIAASNTTKYTNAELAQSANIGLNRAHMLILRADGKWKYDDNNNAASTLINTSTSLSSGDTKVVIPLTWLKIERVRITDANGEYITLNPRQRRQWSDAKLNADAGTPREYALLGNWMHFDVQLNHSSTLEVQYQLGPSYFANDDTTKTPGFAATFHELIAFYMALDYCEINDLEKRAAKIRNRIGRPITDNDPGAGMERELMEYYATRNLDDVPAINVEKEDYGALALLD